MVSSASSPEGAETPVPAGEPSTASSGPRPLLEVRDLSVEFPSGPGEWVRAVDRVSFSLSAGDSMALVGESGSGKTVSTLATMGLAGAVGGRIAGGSVIFDGRDLTKLSAREWERLRGPGMGMIFQQPTRSLNPAFTVGDQIAESVRRHLGVNRQQARTRAVEMLDMVQIPRAAQRVDDYPHQLSGGMAQRAMIAMVMAVSPRLLIADEPTTALDVTVQERILELLRELQAETGVTLLFVSHDLGVVAQICRDVAVMYAGEIVEHGTAAEVFYRPRHPYTAGLLAAVPRPGGGRKRRLVATRGNIPPPGSWPAGCRFHDRCDFAQAGRCDVTHPELTADSLERARCLRADELELRGVTER